MERKTVSRKVFKTPFCREYWHLAVAEFKDTKMIVFAALILALRIAVKPLSIPIAADLKEGIGFIINAFGSMIYGPVVALLNGALSDTLGYLLFPSGVYFPAYMITEMAGSFVFALFLYRAEITVPRLLLCRFAICLGVNVILSYPIHVWYYSVVMGKAYSLALLAKDCGARAHITASDINTAVLSHCAAGVFNASSMRGGDGVSFQNLLLPYRTPNAKIAFSDELRGYITTRQINLAEMGNPASEGILPKMQDVVFIRNVFIYFSQELRARILKVIADRCMAEDGVLFVSMSEIAQIDGSVMPASLEKVSDGSVFYFQKKRTEG